MTTPAATSALNARRALAGIGLRIGSATLFSVMGAALKLASEAGVTAPEMIFYRNAFALPVVAAWAVFGPGLHAVRSRRPLAHLTRSGIGLVSMLFTFQALVLLPLAEATTITFSAPIFATILSALVLGEAVARHRWSAVLVGFVGIVIVARPGGSGHEIPLVGLAVGLAAAVGQAAVMITLRQIATTESTVAIVWWFTILTTIAGALMLPFFGQWHGWGVWPLLALAGTAGGVAQCLMTGSLRLAPVAVVVPFDYLQMLWAIAFGWLVWSDAPGWTVLAGAALIAASGLYSAWREHRRGIRPATADAPPEA